MRRSLVLCVLLTSLCGGIAAGVASAQEPSSATREVRRAPDGSLRRGLLDVPAWAVWATAGVLGCGAIAALGLRLRRSA